MFDLRLREVKDRVFLPSCSYLPKWITPLQLTGAAFAAGLLSGYFAASSSILLSLAFWTLNRILDCMDGSLARIRGTSSDLGGFLDLLGDFTVYSFLPVAVALGAGASLQAWIAVAVLESSFHVNNFVLFYAAAVAEKKSASADKKESVRDITSVIMRPALIEGAESATFFTVMLASPQNIGLLAWIMAGLVAAGTVQRVSWLVPVLR
ncbi:MAG: hypothetical protein Q9220_003613 [cf. Caloplaca sp. 1 TL-2023]